MSAWRMRIMLLPMRSALRSPRVIRFLTEFGCSPSISAVCLIVYKSLFVLVSNLNLLGVYLARLRETKQPLGGSFDFDYRWYWITELHLLGAAVLISIQVFRYVVKYCPSSACRVPSFSGLVSQTRLSSINRLWSAQALCTRSPIAPDTSGLAWVALQ
jgi:hypothetical protein